MALDLHHVCFFEKLPTKYRFVQYCITNNQSMKLTGCDLNWIQPEVLHVKPSKADFKPPKKKEK